MNVSATRDFHASLLLPTSLADQVAPCPSDPLSRADVLGAILLNPPKGSGSITRARLDLAVKALGLGHVRVANIFSLASKDAGSLAAIAKSWDDWIAAREPIRNLLRESGELLFAWGVGEPSGEARAHMRKQVSWVQREALANGHSTYWLFGGAPRHPSRWHRYVSDKHQRTSGGDTIDRYRESMAVHSL